MIVSRRQETTTQFAAPAFSIGPGRRARSDSATRNCSCRSLFSQDLSAGRVLGPYGIEEVLTAPRSPWQNPYVARLIGSVRRECLDHMIVLSEGHLRRILAAYFICYNAARLHLSLDRRSPISRPVCPPEQGEVVAKAYLGGLHHCYTREA